MGYTREDIIDKCKMAIKTPEFFYTYPREKDGKEGSVLVNYRGYSTDSKERYTEIIASFLLEKENFIKLTGIKPRNRLEKRKSYNVNHTGEFRDGKGNLISPENVNHEKEKIIAIDLYRQCKEDGPFDYIGEILDYQTPLNTERNDSFGEIDLLSVNESEKTVYILELKKDKSKKNNEKKRESPETMLRCILEAYTYYKIVDKKELLNCFGKTDYSIKIAPLVFRSDEQYKEWDEMKRGKMPEFERLIKKIIETENNGFDIIPFFLSYKGNEKYKFTVSSYINE